MKKEINNENPLVKIFIISFFGMLLIMSMLIKSFAPTVDTSVGGEINEASIADDDKKIVDGRLEMIQNEDRGKDFADLMSKAEDVPKEEPKKLSQTDVKLEQPQNAPEVAEQAPVPVQKDVVYKVYIGSYTSAEQARVAKDIIQESGSGFSPIVKCIGSNNYTLQVGIFKNKQSAEAMLYSVQQNHLPGRIVQDY